MSSSASAASAGAAEAVGRLTAALAAMDLATVTGLVADDIAVGEPVSLPYASLQGDQRTRDGPPAPLCALSDPRHDEATRGAHA